MKKKKNGIKKTVIKHLKEDIHESKESIAEDKSLEKKLKKDPKPQSRKKAKIEKVMHEFKEGSLHSGSKTGPEVTNPKQAIAIAISESKRMGKEEQKEKVDNGSQKKREEET